MAEAVLKLLDPSLEVHSAGTVPSGGVNPYAVLAMKELGADLSRAKPKHVNQFLGERFDFVITVCSEADRACPQFSGQVDRRLHIGFIDPARAAGTEEDVLAAFRRVRDEILNAFSDFYKKELKARRSF
jgi:arsenate reductase